MKRLFKILSLPVWIIGCTAMGLLASLALWYDYAVNNLNFKEAFKR